MRLSAWSIALVLAAVQPRAGTEPLARVHSIVLPDAKGRIDHLAIDLAEKRLFVAALGNDTLEILDVNRDVHVQSLPGFHEPQGIASLSDAGSIAVANGDGGVLQMVRARDLRMADAVSLGDDADNVRYDSSARVLYVGYGAGGLAAVAADGRKVLGRVNLPGHPEAFQLEHAGSRVFVNVPAAAEIVVVDRRAMKIVGRWRLSRAASNFPMALDEQGHRLFVGCRKPAEILVYDTAGGEALGAIGTVSDADDLFYDAKRQRVYVIGGEGFIDVLDAHDRGRLTRVARVTTAPGARTGLFVPEQQRLYVAVPRRGNQQAEIRIYQVQD